MPINDAADNEVKRYDTNSHVFPLELPPSRLATSGDPTGTAMYVWSVASVNRASSQSRHFYFHINFIIFIKKYFLNIDDSTSKFVIWNILYRDE